MRTFLAALIFCMGLCTPALADKLEEGIASTYANGDGHEWSKAAHCWKANRKTKCERVNPFALTAAHRTLPFGTKIRVTNKQNKKSVIVRINDRGPWKRGRVIDLTPAAAERIGSDGIARVTISAPLLDKARAYMGTNPTGWSRVWCGRFMAMIAPETARRVSNPNLARAWASLPHVGCRVGAIAVLTRGSGGHIGVVSDCTPHGPKVVSGNHNRKVGEAIYSKHRVIAYVAG